MSTTIDETSPDVATRLQAIRSRLPGQMRAGFIRSAVFDPIEAYAEAIPADALLKYDDAVRTGLFEKFLVATPRYYESRQTDPWIVGQVTGTDRYAVIAYWA